MSRLRGLPAATLAILTSSLAAVWWNTDGRYVGDNRFDQYWAPGWRLVRESSLWDGTRGMGRVGEELWPLTLPMALGRALGLSPAATQQIWHVLMLTMAGVGVVVLLRTVQPRVGATHVVAGLTYALSPYAITFLLPTNLFWSFAAAPWMLAVAWRGLRGDQPWRWAAAWALLVAVGGDTDPPGLLLAAVWVIPLAVYLVVVERSVTWRAALAWLARAAVFTTWISLAAMVKVWLGAGALGQRLLTTEGVVEVHQTSSWSESWRGLGYWVTYFSDPARDGDLPGAVGWFETLPGALLTFVVPIAAIAAIARLGWRARILWGGLCVLSVVVMVGSNASGGRSPLGEGLLGAFDALPSLASFRTTYKAGSGLLMGVAVLAATGASAWGATLARRDERLRSVPLAVLALVVFATAIPLWSGRLYADDRQVEAIPRHWIDVAEWIESQPGDARVLVLPGSTQTMYRWGWVGDDILDSLFRRHPNVVPTNFPVSTVLTADIIDAIARRAAEGRLEAADLAAMARRLGIGWVLIRNDVDWAAIEAPRPSAFDSLRDSDDLPLVREFGEPGQDTAEADDLSQAATREAELAPIEVFEVPGMAGEQIPVRRGEAPLLVDGGGDAWPVIAGLGLLDGAHGLRHAGALESTDVTEALRSGSPLVVTDTNRRRLTLIRGPGPTSSAVLGEGADPGPVAPADIFGRSGTQTVALYGDGAMVSEATGQDDLGGFSPWFRPANAFDGDVATSWRTGAQRSPVGDAVEVVLAEATDIGSVRLVPLRTERGQRRVSAVDLDFGTTTRRVEVDPNQPTPVAFDEPVESDRVVITIAEVEGDGDGAVGFAEIDIAGVDAIERLALPDHITGSDDPELLAELTTASLIYVMTRSGITHVTKDITFEEERVLRREFELPATRDLDLTAEVIGGRSLPDVAVAAMVGGEVRAWGSSRPTVPSQGRGGLAIDGDTTTGWVGQATAGEALNLEFPARDVSTVTLRVGSGPNDVPLDSMLVRLESGRAERIDLAPEPGCEEASCDRVGTITLNAGEQSSLSVEVIADSPGQRRVRVLEVDVDGAEGPLPRSEPDFGGCRPGVVMVDGNPVTVRLAAEGVGAADSTVMDQAIFDVEGCEPLPLDAGPHQVTSRLQSRVEQVVLATDGAVDTITSASPSLAEMGSAASDVRRSPGSARVTLTDGSERLVLSGQSYDPDWVATIDDRELGTVIEVDGQSAWLVPEGEGVVNMTYGRQRTFRAALAVSILGAITALIVLIAPAIGRRDRASLSSDR